MQHLAETDPGPEDDHRAYGVFLGEHNTREIRPSLLILMSAVGLVLLVACANVAGLVIARGAARAGEIAIRTAIGAGKTRLVRQLLTENLLLAGFGGAAGLLVAHGCLRILIGMGPREIPRLAETTLDTQVLLFAAAITVVTGLLVGLAPVWTAGRLDLAAGWGSSRWIGSLVFGVSARNPATMAAAALAVIAIAAVAAVVPVWRSIRIDAAGKLRNA